MSIQQRIRDWFGDEVDDPHNRFRSWEHCYRFFQETGQAALAERRDEAALQLGFYLASWGMYRGSSFLLQNAYTIHLPVIDALRSPIFTPFWEQEFGAAREHAVLSRQLLEGLECVRSAYRPFGEATDTLVTKVVLGTLGSVPACDRYFILGFRGDGHPYSYASEAFIERVAQFCFSNLADLRSAQGRIEQNSGVHYPLMKLVDMNFHQLGYELDS